MTNKILIYISIKELSHSLAHQNQATASRTNPNQDPATAIPRKNNQDFYYIYTIYYRVSHKKRFDSSFYTSHPKIIRFKNFFQLITCQLSPFLLAPILFFWDKWFVQNINSSGKSQISVFPGFGHIQISPKKSSDNVMSNLLNRVRFVSYYNRLVSALLWHQFLLPPIYILWWF